MFKIIKMFCFYFIFLFRREIRLIHTPENQWRRNNVVDTLARRWHGGIYIYIRRREHRKCNDRKKTAYIRTRVAPNHASYVRHASKILGWIKNACFRLVCGPSSTPLIYTCLPVACKGTHTRAHVHTWICPHGFHADMYLTAHTNTYSQYVFLPRIYTASTRFRSTILPGPSPLVLLHELERSSLLFLRGLLLTHTRVVSNTKCVDCASQPSSCVRLHLGNQSNPLDREASTTA